MKKYRIVYRSAPDEIVEADAYTFSGESPAFVIFYKYYSGADPSRGGSAALAVRCDSISRIERMDEET